MYGRKAREKILHHAEAKAKADYLSAMCESKSTKPQSAAWESERNFAKPFRNVRRPLVQAASTSYLFALQHSTTMPFYWVNHSVCPTVSSTLSSAKLATSSPARSATRTSGILPQLPSSPVLLQPPLLLALHQSSGHVAL